VWALRTWLVVRFCSTSGRQLVTFGELGGGRSQREHGEKGYRG
jgi:hypothetical protein